MRGRAVGIFLFLAVWVAASSMVAAPNTPSALKIDEHTNATTDSNSNKVLEPYEDVLVEPAWTNNGSTGSITGSIISFTGPTGATYGAGYVSGGSSDYGSVTGGATANCYDATATHSCYQLSVSPLGPRPIQHWDATFTEHLSTGETKAWPIHIGGSFDDVPGTSGLFRFVETMFHKGITGGCGGTNYCPNNNVTRAQLAVFLLIAEHGAGYAPPACSTATFTDVPCSNGFAPFIYQLVNENVTAGCGGGLFCPAGTVTRGSMAVFLLRTQGGPTYTPPACTTPTFADVPCSMGISAWVNELAARGITGGCGSGNYCPNNSVTRGQMAVFLSTTFSLTLYGP